MSADRREKFARLMQVVDAVHCVSDDMRATIASYCPRKRYSSIIRVSTALFQTQQTGSRRGKECHPEYRPADFSKGHAAGLMAMKKLKRSRFALSLGDHG